jgi:hypothetical protein
MKVLKYEDFLETMQYTVLKNAERIAKEEEERRKKSKEEEENRKKQTPKTDKPESKTRIESDVQGQVQTAQGQAQSQSPQGQAQSQSPQGQSQMEEEDDEDY